MSVYHTNGRRHPASLIPKAWHDPALLEFVRSPVTQDMIGELEMSSATRRTRADSPV